MRLFRKNKKDEFTGAAPEETILFPLKRIEFPYKKTKEEAWKALLEKIESQRELQPHSFFMEWKYRAVAAVIAVLVASVSWLAYHACNETVFCPYARQMSVRLPDQSLVSLNAGTRLSYNKLTWKFHRTVAVEGEAFLTVQKGRRFTVKTSEAEIAVLGTSFNVFARSGRVRVNCYTGRVLVTPRKYHTEALVLTPGKETVVSKDEKPAISAFDAERGVAWQKGEFYFNHEPLSMVLQEVERQYNVHIEYRGVSTRFYTGYFTNRNLTETLDLICIPMNLHYQMKGKTIIIN